MNFVLLMLGVAVITGAILLFDTLFLARKRKAALLQGNVEAYERPQWIKTIETLFFISAIIYALKVYNFESILTIVVLTTFVMSALDWIIFSKMRVSKVKSLTESANTEEIRLVLRKPPLWIDYAKSFFPILLVVLLLRSFCFEPYRIPSGSLEPTLLIGDLILVNKYDYGLKLPMTHAKLIEVDEPQRGDIMVLRFPPNPSIYFIKRVIGLPGDKIDYIDKTLYINGKKQPQRFVKSFEKVMENNQEMNIEQREENLGGLKHGIYIIPSQFSSDKRSAVVPEGHYFVMGDNRDDSDDSRSWGFVPEENVVGKAVRIIASFDDVNWYKPWEFFTRMRKDRLWKKIQ